MRLGQSLHLQLWLLPRHQIPGYKHAVYELRLIQCGVHEDEVPPPTPPRGGIWIADAGASKNIMEYDGIYIYISRIIQNIRVENKSLWEVATPPGCFRRTWEVAKAEAGSYIDWLVQRPQTIVGWLYR